MASEQNESPELGEDAIDLEQLQAQIDLSMSFAQSLVSTWVQTAKLPSSSRQQEREKELQEYMRRPTRLGVGATVTEVHGVSRETARLKGKLAGSKRGRAEDDQDNHLSNKTSRSPDADAEDEGESRANAFRKKAKKDPFDTPHGKKKKHIERQQIQQQQNTEQEAQEALVTSYQSGARHEPKAKASAQQGGGSPPPSGMSVTKAMADREQSASCGSKKDVSGTREEDNGSHDQGRDQSVEGGGADEGHEAGSPTKRRRKKKKSKGTPSLGDGQLSGATAGTPSQPIQSTSISTALVDGRRDSPTSHHTPRHHQGSSTPMPMSTVKGCMINERDKPPRESDDGAVDEAKSPKEVEALLASSVVVSPTGSPRKEFGPSLDLLRTPLLNLDGPPPGAEEDSDMEQGLQSPSSPTKKRRRRKKKKRQSQGGGVEEVKQSS